MLRFDRGPFIPIVVILTLVGFGLSAKQPASAAAPGAIPQQSADSSTPQRPVQKNPKAAKRAYSRGKKAEDNQDWQGAFEGYSEAVQLDPRNREYQMRRDLVSGVLVQRHVNSSERYAVSGDMEAAKSELRAAIAIDPEDEILRERLDQMDQPTKPQVIRSFEEPAGEVHLQPQPGTRSFNCRGDTRGAYQEIAKQFGVEVAFDQDLTSRPVRFNVADVNFATAVDVLGTMTDTFWRPLTTKLFFVANNTEQKQREYAVSITRTIVLPASIDTTEMTEMVRLIRDITGVTRTELDTTSRTLTLRSTPRAVQLASELVENLEQHRAELALEFEILEVDRNRARELGITPPQSSQIYTISGQQLQQAQTGLTGLIGVLTQVFGTPSSLSGLSASQIAGLVGGGLVGGSTLLPPLVAFGGGNTTTFASVPGIAANFSSALSLVRSGQRILLRAEDGQPATFFVGERYPIDLGQFSSSLTSAENVPTVSTSNFPTSNYATGTSPVAIATGQFDTNNSADGIDFAIVNQTDKTVSILLNNGSGNNFTPAPGNPPATGNVPAAIVTGQFNPNSSNDHTDLAVANFNCSGNPLVCGPGSLTILLANGDGTFTPTPATVPTGHGPIALATGQFNLKGNADHTDLAVANEADNTVSILLSNGDGTFTQAPGSPITVGRNPSSIAVADFNGDGVPDLAITNETDNTMTILLGNGNGTFVPALGSPYATGNTPVSVVSADFNGDTFNDLAVVDFTDAAMAVFLGNGNGTFQAATAYPTGVSPTAAAVADFNVDGLPDIAVTSSAGDAVSILLNIGSGQFAPQFNLPVGTNPLALAAGDFSGDSLPDAAVVNQGSNTVSVILNSSSFVGSNVASPSLPFPYAEFEDLGVKIKATPRVNTDKEISLQLEFDIKALAGSSINGIPIISNRMVEQYVRVRDGQMAILAGMMDREATNTLSSLPGLDHLGPLNNLTGTTNLQTQDDELLFLITPRIVEMPERSGKILFAGHEPPGALSPVNPVTEPGGPRPAFPGAVNPLAPGQAVPEQNGPPARPTPPEANPQAPGTPAPNPRPQPTQAPPPEANPTGPDTNPIPPNNQP